MSIHQGAVEQRPQLERVAHLVAEGRDKAEEVRRRLNRVMEVMTGRNMDAEPSPGHDTKEPPPSGALEGLERVLHDQGGEFADIFQMLSHLEEQFSIDPLETQTDRSMALRRAIDDVDQEQLAGPETGLGRLR